VEVLSGEAAVASEGLDRAPPVSDGRSVTGADFAEKVVEMTETAEEAVVSKTARVKEEVLISKDATERTETVRDTVRREIWRLPRMRASNVRPDPRRPRPLRPTPKSEHPSLYPGGILV
jgi:stress response protein YsnF